MLSEGNVLTRARFIVLLLLVGWASSALPQDALQDEERPRAVWFGRDYPTNVLYEEGLLRALRTEPKTVPNTTRSIWKSIASPKPIRRSCCVPIFGRVRAIG